MTQTDLPLSLVIKLASLVVHVQEATSDTGHPLDIVAACTVADDPEVAAWLATVDPAFLPEKRS